MRRVKLSMVAIFGCLVLLTGSFTANAGQKSGGGGSTTPVIITFRDCNAGFPSAAFANLHPEVALLDLCPVLDDRIKSDDGMPYEDGVALVQAFIGSEAKFGNVLLRLAKSPRGLLFDFADCVSPGNCKPPFASQVVSLTSIEVDAEDVRKDGLLGMATGEVMSVPMQVYFRLVSPDEGPGRVFFDPGLNGREVCKGRSDYVTAKRTGDATWEIVGELNDIACVTLPSSLGGGWAGNYRMPLQFTVQIK